MKYFEVEVTRTVTERRKIYVSAENGDTDDGEARARSGHVSVVSADRA